MTGYRLIISRAAHVHSPPLILVVPTLSTTFCHPSFDITITSLIFGKTAQFSQCYFRCCYERCSHPPVVEVGRPDAKMDSEDGYTFVKVRMMI